MGYCMSYVRSPNENNLNAVESVMSVLWHIVPSVEGISFRDIKAVLRREQCDAHLLLTANVPGAKKVVVHGPDLTSIPSQLPVQEDTQFEELLAESLDFFGIADADRKGYILTDSKTGRAHHPNGFVRDVYFFRRSFYPQLNLVRLPEREAFTKLQFQACHNLFLEAQKVFLVSSLFQNALLKSDSALQQQQAMLLEDGLTKIPNFPRKALECDVKFQDGQFGCQYLGIDIMHKYSWIQVSSFLLQCVLPRRDIFNLHPTCN
jgi:protein unc-80